MNLTSAGLGLLGGGFSLSGSLLGGGGGLLKSLGGSLLSGLAATLRAGLSQILGVLSGLVSSTLKMIMGLPRVVLTGISRLSEAVIGALGNTARALSGLLGGALKAGVGLLAGAIGGLSIGLSRAVTITSDWGRRLTELRAVGGIGASDAGRVQRRFGALGIDTGSLGNERQFAMRASVYGLPSYTSANFLPLAASKYQNLQSQGLVGQAQAASMAGALGLDSPEARRALMSSPSQLREQQSFADRTARSFGVNDGAVESTGRLFDNIVNKLKTIGEVGVVAIGQRLLPSLNSFLGNALGIFERFNGGASGMIDKGVSAILGGIRSAADGFISLATFLAIDAPKAAFSFADSLLSGLQTALSSIPSLFGSFLTGVDFVQNALVSMAQNAADGMGALMQIGAGVWDNLKAGLGSVTDIFTAGLQTVEQVGTRAFSAILGGLDSLYRSDFVQQIIRALPAGMTLVETAGKWASKAHRSGEDMANRLGVSPDLSALIGLAAPTLALRGIGGMLGGGLLKGAGALWGGAMANPLTRPLIDGGALGMLGYSAIQRTGILGKEAPGAFEALSNSWKRIRNVATGADYNLNVSQMRGTDAQHAAFEASQRINPLGGVSDAMQSSLGNINQLFKNNLSAASFARSLPSSRVDSSQVGGIGSDILSNLQRSLAPHTGGHGSWAQGLEDSMGKYAGMSGAAGEEIQAMRDELYGKRDEVEARGGALLQQLTEIKTELMKSNATQAKYFSEASKMSALQAEHMRRTGQYPSQILARALAYDAQDAFLVQSRVS